MSLYKYMSEDRVENILVDNKIRFTQPVYFNDPFDVQPHIQSPNIKGFVNKINDKSKGILLSRLISFLVENGMRDNDFNTDEHRKAFLQGLNDLTHDEIDEHIKNTFNKEVNDSIGILSLTKDYENLLMWAHYANEYKGFIVEFEKKSELFSNALKVEYKEERPSVKMRRIEPNRLFFTKSIHWKYENEYRVLKMLKDALPEDINLEKDMYLFRFPKIVIKSIYCGCNMDINIKKKISSIVENDKELSHVKIFDSYISDKYYKLEFVQVR